MSNVIRLKESWPFDSYDTEQYDKWGFPLMDRAVRASALRSAFRQFFTTGIFAAPSTNMKVTKGEGLSVTILHGWSIIDGSMASTNDIEGDAEADLDGNITITLATEPPRGEKTYSIILMMDDNADARSQYIRVEETAGPIPYEPVIEGAVHELRLGYVTVPSNATDLESATIYDERGTSMCPYAAPFMEVDIAGILDEVKGSAFKQYNEFMEMLNANIEFVQSALDETTAGYLQNRINELSLEAIKRDDIDNETIYFNEQGKLSAAKSLESGNELDSYTWDEIAELSKLAAENPDDYTYLIGQTKRISIAGYGSVDAMLIGVAHDNLADGSGKAGFTFMLEQIVDSGVMYTTTKWPGWEASVARSTTLPALLEAFPEPLASLIATVTKKYTKSPSSTAEVFTCSDDLFLASYAEVFGNSISGTEVISLDSIPPDGSQYQYFAENPTSIARSKRCYFQNSVQVWGLRSAAASNKTYAVRSLDATGSVTPGDATTSTTYSGLVPCFCI